jgi:hypothetical protein
LIEQALALPATQLRGRVVESRRETLARLTEDKVRCKKSKQSKQDDPPVALADDAEVHAEGGLGQRRPRRRLGRCCEVRAGEPQGPATRRRRGRRSQVGDGITASGP